MTRPTFALQMLESRRLLSASAVEPHDCPEVTEAREDLHEVAVQYHQDRREGRAALKEIRAEIAEELRELYAEKGDEIREAIAPLREELAEAIKSQVEQRRAVLQDLHEVREKWAPIIAEDVKAVLKAKADGDEEALAEATEKIIADRNALKAELLPLKQQLEEVMKETRLAISEARTAIEDKLAEFSDTLKDLLDELRTKAKEIETTLIADHNAVVAAQQNLREAIAECREEHAGEDAIA
jgi:hypothetical protein